jgi:hypothetical protein
VVVDQRDKLYSIRRLVRVEDDVRSTVYVTGRNDRLCARMHRPRRDGAKIHFDHRYGRAAQGHNLHEPGVDLLRPIFHAVMVREQRDELHGVERVVGISAIVRLQVRLAVVHGDVCAEL